MARHHTDPGCTLHDAQRSLGNGGTFIHRRMIGFCSDSFKEVIRGGRFEHDVLGARHLSATLQRVIGTAITLDRGHYSFATVVHGDFDPKRICLGMVHCPNGAARINGCRIRPDDLQCYAEGADMMYAAGVDTRWIGIQVDLNAVRVGHPSIELGAERFMNMSLEPASAAGLRHCVSSLIQDACQGHSAAAGEQSLLQTIGEIFAQPKAIKQLAHERCELVRRAASVVHGQLGLPYSSQRICDALDVSERVLQLAFRQCLGMSPSRWYSALRLNRVRGALIRADAKVTTVTSVASSHGFEHLGRFARDYKDHFGETPSTTLSR